MKPDSSKPTSKDGRNSEISDKNLHSALRRSLSMSSAKLDSEATPSPSTPIEKHFIFPEIVISDTILRRANRSGDQARPTDTVDAHNSSSKLPNKDKKPEHIAPTPVVTRAANRREQQVRQRDAVEGAEFSKPASYHSRRFQRHRPRPINTRAGRRGYATGLTGAVDGYDLSPPFPSKEDILPLDAYLSPSSLLLWEPSPSIVPVGHPRPCASDKRRKVDNLEKS
ncbi:hypothetical protein O181_009575 [Austropuccinia psidii MF-1]|uniref:Uncharacterized protein n=1 Tax=Austropuccinia psidii MF-1 TaxID=1389203 RepID=A0A9Q3BS80_9BASI|nr:hypothetical protein [Austropuccinia psidii MF-1]